MLKFLVYDDRGQPTENFSLRGAYLLGIDNTSTYGNITFDAGIIHCQKRESSAVALAVQRTLEGCGELIIQTCLLPDRAEPYLLHIELARHRLMSVYAKLEEWVMFDIDPEHPFHALINEARNNFIDALCHQSDSPAEADSLARTALVAAVKASEVLAETHAELLLTRRKNTRAMPRRPIGCGVQAGAQKEQTKSGFLDSFDFHSLPISWRALAPEEGEYNWEPFDRWASWLSKRRKPVIAGPVISFDPRNVPDWLFIWEHDYDTVRDLVYEHTERVVTRYRNAVTAWDVVSGLHINSHFTFSFEQLMDLTRMTMMLVKQIQPVARALVEIREPFGEYHGVNPRSIPPLMYADLLIQNAINFDGFVLKLVMGQAMPGQYTRDLMQLSSLLDQFVNFGKPVNLMIAVPSSPVATKPAGRDGRGDPRKGDRRQTAPDEVGGGYWHEPWSETMQGRWLEAASKIAMSKPFVDSVCWTNLADHQGNELASSGLIREDQAPKPAFQQLVALRDSLQTAGRTTTDNAEVTDDAQPAQGTINQEG